MRVHSWIILLGVAWFLLGGLLAVGLHVRLSGVCQSTTELTDRQLPLALAMDAIRGHMLHAQATCHRLAAATTLPRIAQECTALRGQLWQVETELEALDGMLTDPRLRAGYRPTYDAIAAWHHAARRMMIEREGELPASMAQALSDELQTLPGETMLTDDHQALEPVQPAMAVIAFAPTSLDELMEHFSRAADQFVHFMETRMRPTMNTRTESMRAAVAAIRNESIALIVLACAAGCALTILMARMVHQQQRTAQMAQERQAFDARVVDALGMQNTEASTMQLVEGIITHLDPTLPAVVLIADSSRAHLHQAAVTPAVAQMTGDQPETPLCAVRSPSACPAVRRGFEVTFRSSGEFDACPYMRNRPSGPCSATCVPITITGQQVGVLHAVTPDGKPLEAETIQRLTAVAAKTGERIGVIRAFSRSEDQAAKDALTGLLNRRSAEERVQQMQRAGTSFCIVYADIDHFKQLNDTHGHETGDRVLRHFSRTLREALRPTDVVARWGGEEFVMLLPDATLEQAQPVIERLRQAVAECGNAGSIPAITASFGLAICGPRDDFAEQLNEADAALLRAKQAGRNRIVFAGVAIPA